MRYNSRSPNPEVKYPYCHYEEPSGYYEEPDSSLIIWAIVFVISSIFLCFFLYIVCNKLREFDKIKEMEESYRDAGYHRVYMTDNEYAKYISNYGHDYIHDPNCAKCKEIESINERIPKAETEGFVK